ncbi:acyl-coenzyme A thioesterase 9, mitochondrial isoform X7 [Eretmochelys imbricata]
MLARGWCTVRKAPSLLARALTSMTNGFQSPPDMSEGHLPIHVNNVRSRLRAIVGASTNWSDHVQAMHERKDLHILLAKQQEDLPPRKMNDSYIEVILPLGSQPELREKYLNVHNSVRFGRILEDLDSLGVLICYTHTKHEASQRSPLSIVTALVDKIDLCKKVIYPDCDIKFTGNVSWVGKTSMEVKMHMFQLHDDTYSPVLDATFVMVARDPENKRPAFVNPLTPEGPEEEEIFRKGELNKIRRVDFSTASLLKMAPTAEERTTVHNIFLNTLDTRTVSFRSRVLPPNSVWMEDAKLKGLEICHPQVCFTEKNYIQIRVHSEVYDSDTREHKTTNVFHFTFMSEGEVPQIVPKTYGESMLYLDGKRHFSAAMKETREVEKTTAAP